VFDGSILAIAAASAPEVMIKLAGDALARLRDLCHPNTVRHRLRRIEKHTGRSLSRPKDVAELCLAFEAHHQLM
jgi:sugar diacid utilization regulator